MDSVPLGRKSCRVDYQLGERPSLSFVADESIAFKRSLVFSSPLVVIAVIASRIPTDDELVNFDEPRQHLGNIHCALRWTGNHGQLDNLAGGGCGTSERLHTFDNALD